MWSGHISVTFQFCWSAILARVYIVAITSRHQPVFKPCIDYLFIRKEQNSHLFHCFVLLVLILCWIIAWYHVYGLNTLTSVLLLDLLISPSVGYCLTYVFSLGFFNYLTLHILQHELLSLTLFWLFLTKLFQELSLLTHSC